MLKKLIRKIVNEELDRRGVPDGFTELVRPISDRPFAPLSAELAREGVEPEVEVDATKVAGAVADAAALLGRASGPRPARPNAQQVQRAPREANIVAVGDASINISQFSKRKG